MSGTYWRDRDDGVVPERLTRFVEDLLQSDRTRTEVEDELMQHGIDRDTAADMVTRSLDARWIRQRGGSTLGRAGSRHMIAGAALLALGVAAIFGSAHFADVVDGNVGVLFYGAIGAGAIEIAYGLSRFLEG